MEEVALEAPAKSLSAEQGEDEVLSTNDMTELDAFEEMEDQEPMCFNDGKVDLSGGLPTQPLHYLSKRPGEGRLVLTSHPGWGGYFLVAAPIITCQTSHL
ncbi:hypothetical protein QJS10_CPA03g01395 [Acorus calamus]|uniref:Uncharacterized protein n=1 Tax=Acorus calamus TaxID=4465 RepID=A0AAV9F6C3_ACOCL|nr:hypothetical protein QJS10_CPA03g01395 [Acorus calamus]